MNQERAEIMEKARARRRRLKGSKSPRAASRKRKAPSTDTDGSLTEKVIDLAQEAAGQIGAFVKTAADKITGAPRRRTVANPGCSTSDNRVPDTNSSKSAKRRRD
jgi:hypothetical protein